ncbi:hypothetical protein BGZ59_008464 [Podila verticillata]|nr:hypothetical protein BGZ59_008464 [Podila verticillata]
MSASAQPVRSVDRRFTTTAFEYPGYFIAQAHGVVRGITVRNPNAGKAILGAFASFTGGESSTYIEMAEKARERAFLRMLEHAAAAGGNVMAYGTSVTLVPLQQQQPPQQPVYSPMSSPYQPQQIPQSQPYNPAQPQSYNPAQPVFAAPAPPAKQ